MKHHDSLRPIGKCKGCCLNLRVRCAAGLAPKVQWDHGRCKSYNDTALLRRLQQESEPTGAKQAKVTRRAQAIAKAAEPHYNGALDPAKMAGWMRRAGR